MTNEATINKLHAMKLSAMAEAFRQQLNDPSISSVSFEERFGMIVDRESSIRMTNRLHRLIRNANFDQAASIYDINYESGRKLDKICIDRLSTCEYIKQTHNVIITGATGTGKSYLACALGMEACKQHYTVKYIRLPELLADLALAHGTGKFKEAVKQYQKCSLLILDEWLLVPISEPEVRDLLEIIHARHKKASIIFCSQFSPMGWHKKLTEPTIADAILDRIVHNSYNIEIQAIDKNNDKSMREFYGIHNMNGNIK